MYRIVFVALDGSEEAERALPMARLIAAAHHARVVVGRAVSGAADADLPALIDESDDMHDPLCAAGAYLGDVAQRLAGLGCDVQTAVLGGDPATAIVEGAARWGADVIVMATHGRRGLDRLAHGSVADRVLRAARVPVLLVGPAAPTIPPAIAPSAEPAEEVHGQLDEVPLTAAVGAAEAVPSAAGAR